MNLTDEEKRALLGKRVRVTLDKPGQAEAVIVTGKLLGFGEGGDFEIEDDFDLMVHYCWPMLRIEAL